MPIHTQTSHSQQVSQRVVLLDYLEGPGVRDFSVGSVGEPARSRAGDIELESQDILSRLASCC